MPATIGAAPLVPFQSTSPPSAETPTSSSLGAETPIVMPCVDASRLAWPVRVDARDGQHARDRRGGADARRAAPPVAGGDDDDDVVLERVEERVIPALVPVGGVGRERQVDDVRAVVDRPADRLGDLVGERDATPTRRSRPRSTSSSASGATPIMPVPGPVPRAAASEATQLPWFASTAPTGRPAVGRSLTPRHPCRPTTAPANSTGPAPDARVDDRDAHARAARRLSTPSRMP